MVIEISRSKFVELARALSQRADLGCLFKLLDQFVVRSEEHAGIRSAGVPAKWREL